MLATVHITPIRCKFSLKKKNTDKMADLSIWTQRQLSRVKQDFEEADKDHGGFLSFCEVCEVLRKSGFKGTDEEAQRIFKSLDLDGNRSISKDEFVSTMAKVPKIDFKMLVMRRAFKRLDADNSGFLTQDEILAATSSEAVGMDIKADQISDMLIAHVKDQDGRIEYEEFLDIWLAKRVADVMKNVFQKLDKDNSKTLSPTEMLDGLQHEPELNLHAQFISDLLISYCRGDTVDYDLFCEYYVECKQCKKQK